jgi:hypothetical protein
MDVTSRRVRKKRAAIALRRKQCGMFEEGNNCKTVYNRIRDTMAPFLATVTIGLYGYKANNSIRGYVASGESASEVSLRNQSELVAGVRREPSQ